MKYEIHIVQRIGRLMTAALEDAQVSRLPSRSQVTVVALEPTSLNTLVHHLHGMGLEIASVRVRCVPGGTTLQHGA